MYKSKTLRLLSILCVLLILTMSLSTFSFANDINSIIGKETEIIAI